MLDLRTYRSEQVKTAAPTPVPAAEAEISDPTRTITGEQQMDWLKESLRTTGPQWKVIGNPVMIAPVNFGARPDAAARPDQRRHRPAARGRLPLQRRPVGRLHRRPARGLQAHPQPPGRPTRSSSPATSTPAGRASCRTTPRPTPPATRPAWSSSAPRSPPNNLKDITGAPPRTASLAVEAGDHGQQPAHQVPQLRRPRLLRPRPDQPARPDGLVRHRRPRGQGHPDHLDAVVRRRRRAPARGRGRTGGRWARDGSSPFAARPCRARHRAPYRARALAAPACCSRRRPPWLARQAAERARSRAAKRRAYVLVIDGCRPDEIDEGLTPRLLALRDGGMRYPRRVVDAGDGDHPQPRDDDDRRAARPHRRAGQQRSSTARSATCATWTGPATSRSSTVIERLNRARLPDRDGAQQGVPLRHLRRPRDPPLGAAADRAGLRARAGPVHDGGRAGDDRRGRPAPGVRQPRRHRPVRPLAT